MRTSVTVETRTEETVTIKPALRTRLIGLFRQYQALSAQATALEVEKKALRGKIAEIREEIGVTTLTLEGFTTTLVAPVLEKLNIKKLLKLGVTEAQIKAATDVTAGTIYERVTVPKRDDDSE